jgi:hypothetical protein
MREHRTDMTAILEITRSADGRHIFQGDPHVIDAGRALEHLLSGFQTAGQFRPDFDPCFIAIAIRAAIDTVPSRLALDPEFDIDNYASEIATIFDLATRVEGGRDCRPAPSRRRPRECCAATRCGGGPTRRGRCRTRPCRDGGRGVAGPHRALPALHADRAGHHPLRPVACSVVESASRARSNRSSPPPIRREEFLIGKALAAFLPALCVAYVIFGTSLGPSPCSPTRHRLRGLRTPEYGLATRPASTIPQTPIELMARTSSTATGRPAGCSGIW